MVYQQKIRSCIKPELLRLSLKKGGTLAAFGSFLIIVTGSFLPFFWLKVLGLPFFITGLTLIGIGLYPYKKLSQLQIKPHELHDLEVAYVFFMQGKALFHIPKNSIHSFKFVEKEHDYGIAISLKNPLPEKIKVLKSNFDIKAFIQASKEKFPEACLYLPYFTEKDTLSLFKDLLESDHAF